jgi:hypothetical protein
MNTRIQTPEQLAMIAAGEGRNAFANLRANHADLLVSLKQCLPFVMAHYLKSGEGSSAIYLANETIEQAEKLA